MPARLVGGPAAPACEPLPPAPASVGLDGLPALTHRVWAS